MKYTNEKIWQLIKILVAFMFVRYNCPYAYVNKTPFSFFILILLL